MLLLLYNRVKYSTIGCNHFVQFSEPSKARLVNRFIFIHVILCGQFFCTLLIHEIFRKKNSRDNEILHKISASRMLYHWLCMCSHQYAHICSVWRCGWECYITIPSYGGTTQSRGESIGVAWHSSNFTLTRYCCVICTATIGIGKIFHAAREDAQMLSNSNKWSRCW